MFIMLENLFSFFTFRTLVAVHLAIDNYSIHFAVTLYTVFEQLNENLLN